MRRSRTPRSPHPGSARLVRAVLDTVLLGGVLLFAGPARAAPKPEAAPPEPPCDTRVQVVNHSARPVFELYVRRSRGPGDTRGDAGAGWGPELLGSRVLQRDGEFTVSPKEPGRYDVLLLTAEDRAQLLWRQDFCAISTVRLEEDGRVAVR